jgi:thermitase
MKKLFILFLVMAALVSIPAGNTKLAENTSSISSGNSKYAAGHFIVKLKKSENVFAASNPYTVNYESKIREISASLNLTVNRIKPLYPAGNKNLSLYNKYEFESYFVVYIDGTNDINEVCADFSKSSKVDFAEPDFIGEGAGRKGTELSGASIPNDELYRKQWGLNNDGSVKTTTGRMGRAGADMNVFNAWDIETGSEDVIVAILDSGAKTDHPDLSGRLWINGEETKNGRDDDGNGFIDDINGYNFAYDNPNVKDDGGHGTNIAGTVGASTNNALGYAGIDQKCRLMVCKNLDDENLGEYSWWSASLYYAANNGARVINMSEGGYDYSKTLENAINFAYDAGCLIVASMMNKNNGDSYYPASFKNVMAIGATDTDDARCREFTWGGGSNWGKHISVIAPGNRVYGLDYNDNYNYDVYWSGTSQATAYVSGVASILLGQDPSRSNRDLKEIITKSAIDQVGDPREDTKGWDQYYGYGRVDLYEALNFGKSPSGKKDRVFENETEDHQIKEKDDNGRNNLKAKANDPTDEEDKYRTKDEKRARKPKPDDR